MAYAISVSFDDATRARLAALPFFANGGIVDTSPHLSLAIADTPLTRDQAETAASYLGACPRFTLPFRSVGVLRRDETLFLNPIPSSRLLRLHAGLIELLGRLGAPFKQGRSKFDPVIVPTACSGWI